MNKKRTNCLMCNKDLTKKKIWDRQLFCSALCSIRYRNKDRILEFSCKRCKKALTKKQSRTNCCFCSIACARQYNTDYGYDLAFLDNDSELRSYFLGYWMCDGSIYGKRYDIRISSIDEQIINDLGKKVNFTNKINKAVRKGNAKDQYTIRFGKPIFDKIVDFGIKPEPKTGKEFIPNCISKKTFLHFLRGVIDGDGSFKHNKTNGYIYLNCSIYSASFDFLNDILQILKNRNIVKRGKIYKNKKGIFVLSFAHYDAVSIGDFIYKNETIKLERKFNKYLLLKNNKGKTNAILVAALQN